MAVTSTAMTKGGDLFGHARAAPVAGGKTWMAGTSPAMTGVRAARYPLSSCAGLTRASTSSTPSCAPAKAWMAVTSTAMTMSFYRPFAAAASELLSSALVSAKLRVAFSK